MVAAAAVAGTYLPAASADVPQAQVASTSCDPSVCNLRAITVPENPADPTAPHYAVSGLTVTLKGEVLPGAANVYRWDFGDGTTTGWQAFANPYALAATHVYNGAVGTTFAASLSVANSANEAVANTDSYPVVIASGSDLSSPADTDVRARIAIDDGLWWLHANSLTRVSGSGSNPPYAYAGTVGATCEMAYVMERLGHLPTNDPNSDPYAADVQQLLNYTTRNLTVDSDRATRTFPDGASFSPDVSGDGLAVASGAGDSVGPAAICLSALARSGEPNATITIGLAALVGKTYKALVQDMADYLLLSQDFSTASAGGWSYSSDEAGIGFVPEDEAGDAARALYVDAPTMEATYPSASLNEHAHWVDSDRNITQSSPFYGGYCHYVGGCPIYTEDRTTGEMLVSIKALGYSGLDNRVTGASSMLYNDWNDMGGANCWQANIGWPSSMARITTGLVAIGLTRITSGNGQNSFDWYYTPAGQSFQGYAAYLIRSQSGGAWNASSGCGPSDDDTGNTPTEYVADDIITLSKDFSAPLPAVPPPPVTATTTSAPTFGAGTPTVTEPLTLTATVTPAPGAGAVGFTDENNNPLCSAPVDSSGNATCTWTPQTAGTNTVTAAYSGTAGFVASSNSAPVTVAKLTPAVTAPAATTTYGVPLDSSLLAAIVTGPAGASAPAPTGSITYTYTLSDGRTVDALGATPSAGSTTISAHFVPDAASSAWYTEGYGTLDLTVNPAVQAIDFPAPAAHTFGDPAFTVSATGGGSTSPVSFATAGGDTCQLSGPASAPDSSGRQVGTVTVTLTGTAGCTLTASQSGDTNYNAAASVTHSLTVLQATPTIIWPKPAQTTYGGPVSPSDLDATATGVSGTPLAGTWTYRLDDPAVGPNPIGVVPNAGPHTLYTSFTPDDSTDYSPVTASVSLTVAQAPQSVTFPAVPGNHTFGDDAFTVAVSPGPSTSSLGVAALSPAVCNVQLDSIGWVVSILHAGTCTLEATQDGDTNYLAASPVDRSFAVAQAVPQLSWNAADLTYGTSLAVEQTATANVEGTFGYTYSSDGTHFSPLGADTYPAAGTYTLSAGFVPTDTTDYTTPAMLTRTLTVAKATPVLSWSAPPAIVYGTALGSAQLDATVAGVDGQAVAGTFTYTPAAGTILDAGNRTLSVTFTPTDTADYNSASSTTAVTVNKADQTISIDPVSAHTFGDADFTVSAAGGNSTSPVVLSTGLGDSCNLLAQTPSVVKGVEAVDATVHLSGASGCSLSAGQSGDGNYNAAKAVAVELTIGQATPLVNWPAPAPITYGTALSAAQLDATATGVAGEGLAGSFAYNQPAGTVLHAGTYQLSASFAPGDSTDYVTGTTATTTLIVNQAPQSIGLGSIAGHTYGDAPFNLNATPGPSGVAVTYSGTGNCTVSSAGTVTITGAGSCTVTANEAGNNDYLPAPAVSQTFQIAKASRPVSFGPIADHAYGDAPFNVTATSDGSSAPIVFSSATPGSCSVSPGGLVSIAGPGTCTVVANQGGDANFNPSQPVTQSFSISYHMAAIGTSTKAQANGTLQVQVEILNANGVDLSSRSITVKMLGLDGNPSVPSPGNSQPNQMFRFATSPASYQYDLTTRGLAPGNHTLTYSVGSDPTVHTLTITIG